MDSNSSTFSTLSASTHQDQTAVEGATSPPQHVLVVDDDRMIQHIVAIGLRRLGYQVDCVADGEAAWELLCIGSYDLVISDHEMPCLCGLDLLRRMRARNLEVPAILMSGNMPTHAADFETLLPIGAALDKPFSLAQLMSRVQLVLPSGPKEGDEHPLTEAFAFRNKAITEKPSAAA